MPLPAQYGPTYTEHDNGSYPALHGVRTPLLTQPGLTRLRGGGRTSGA